MSEILFKATRLLSESCNSYRQIEKSGNLEYDIYNDSDDVISLIITSRTRIIIDCDKSGVFHLKFDSEKVVKED